MISVFVYHSSNNKGAISTVLRYNSNDNITLGYILLSPCVKVAKVHDAIRSEFLGCSHPLIIPTIIIELAVADTLTELTALSNNLLEIEKGTGCGDWVNEMSTNLQKFPSNEKPSSFESQPDIKIRCRYKDWTKKLGILSCKLAFYEGAIRCATMANNSTLREAEAMKEYIPASKRESMKRPTLRLKGRAEFLASSLAHLEIFGGLAKRVQTQQEVVSRDFQWLNSTTNF